MQTSGSTVLCGRNAVQVVPAEKLQLTLEELAKRLQAAGIVTQNPFLVRVTFSESNMEMTVFADGRAIVKGTEDTVIARAVYARHIGI
jgi:adenylyltransferase/sulfurtransferase